MLFSFFRFKALTKSVPRLIISGKERREREKEKESLVEAGVQVGNRTGTSSAKHFIRSFVGAESLSFFFFVLCIRSLYLINGVNRKKHRGHNEK